MTRRDLLASLFLLPLAGTVVGLPGCGGGKEPAGGPAEPPTKAKHGTIGVSLLTLGNPFFKEMGDAITAAATAEGYTTKVVSAEMDPARQRDQVRDFLAADVVAIILTPADSKAVGTAIQEANAKKVPVFTADIASLAADAKVVSHVATDNHAGGAQAGEAAVEALKGTGKVAIIDHPEVESGMLRIQGFEEVVAKHPGMKVVAKLPGYGQRDRSFKVAQDILQAHPDVNLIFGVNDPTALGVVAALEAASKVGQVKVIGFDGQPEAKAAIKAGKIYADAVQYPDRIGKLAVERVVKYLAGEAVPPVTLIPTGLYRKADADAEATKS
ncbi:substrate-binding domain-containing protein [Limnoglobus roseus]|uniref:Sugar ABC transporter substrate-binding protein n=1 Tax=Limnoglobus roseus TaxID=2598579 RepID=A0A5C1ACL0_9BACT|nr:substrate-binding domain-containing protein [Limnoglobus roseus]QEL17129.1 sugar ABC transporter substrate-binding protein [Limnoglobus roseus]